MEIERDKKGVFATNNFASRSGTPLLTIREDINCFFEFSPF